MTRTARSAFRLLVLAPYPLGRAPNQRFRFEQYLPAFAAAGWTVDVRTLMTGRVYDWFYRSGSAARKAAFLIHAAIRRVADTLSSPRYDAVLIVRESLPVGPALLERVLRRVAKRLVFDFDDAIWLPSTSEGNRLWSWLKSPEKTATIVALCDQVIAGNDYLADYARSHGARVAVIPTTIDTDAYVPTERRPASPLIVGWSGSPTTAGYLDLIAAPLRRLQRDLGIEILTVGAPSWKPDGLRVASHPWTLDGELDLLRRIDVGLMPLTDDAWSRGKCGLKALQYMALGAATVVSPVGVNTEIVSHGSDGLHARTEDDWYEAIAACVRDDVLLRRLGEAGRQTVEQRYSVRANSGRWIEALAGRG